MATSGFGYVLSTVINREESAVPMVTVFMMPAIQFGGFLVNAGSIPWYLTWLQYLSPIRYTLEAIANNEFENRTYDLGKGEINPLHFLGFNFGTVKCYVLLLTLAIGLRLVSLVCLKLLVSKF